MGQGFLMLSMWSAISAFTGLMLLVHVAIVVLRWFGVEIWNDVGSSPHAVMASLSNEDKEKIEKLRSSAIMTHLKKYSLTLNGDNIVSVASTMKQNLVRSTTENVGDEEESEQSDIEHGTNNDNKDKSEESETQDSLIRVPLAGQLITSYDTIKNTETRNVPNTCVICHEDYNISDEVCWSSNQECTHVFHKDCMVSWLTCLGWIKLKELREIEKCMEYDLECPVCRTSFISKEELQSNAQTTDAEEASTIEERV